MPGKVAYVMSRFPHLPETFILREMIALEAAGQPVALYPLMVQRQSMVHPDAVAWVPRAVPLPFVSLGVIGANVRQFVRQPGRYLRALATVLRENWAERKMFVRAVALWPKAVYAATLMQQDHVVHVHAHYATHPAMLAWVVNALTGISYSLTVHAHDIFVHKAMLAEKLRSAAFVVGISEFNRRYLADVVGPWVLGKIDVIHCGIEPARYAGKPAVPRDRFEIITTGSLQPYKGQRHLVDACALLRDRGIPFRCRVIGGGELEGDLRERIAAHGLEAQVVLLGPRTQDEVTELLKTAHCYAQPSVITDTGKMEGIPVSIMEAFASGLPVVASDLSGIPELVRPSETGYLVPPGDAGALADALAAVWADLDAANALAEAGRALVAQEFDLSHNVRELADRFAVLIQSHG